MDVALVTTYPPQRCGIATYSAALAPALAAAGARVTVLAERGAGESSGGPTRVVPCFLRAGDFSVPVVRAAVAAGARVLHLQHSPDIFGMDDRTVRLLDAARSHGLATFVTLHTVHTTTSGALERRFRVARFHRAVADVATRVIVHGRQAKKDVLEAQGVFADRVVVVAHGTGLVQRPSRDAARRSLGLPASYQSAPIVLYFGFIHPQKNLHTILLAMPRLRRLVPGARLLVVGSIQNRSRSNRAYLWACRRAVAGLGLRDHVLIREGFVESSQVPTLHGAADLVVLPYAQRYGSASGIVHGAFGAGSVVLCSDSPKFAEVGERVAPSLQVSTHSPSAWAERAAELLSNEVEREALTARIRRHAEATSWPRVAERHLEVYGGGPAGVPEP